MASTLRSPSRERLERNYHEYERRKLEWIERHPDASSREYEQAMRKLAEELGL